MNECCAELSNREQGPGPRGTDGLGDSRNDVTITHCTVCESRHLEAEADVGQLGVVGKGL